MFNKKKKAAADAKHEEIMKAVISATDRGQCVILATTPQGTRVTVLGQSKVQQQVEEILKREDF